jgi:hypothetical protein
MQSEMKLGSELKLNVWLRSLSLQNPSFLSAHETAHRSCKINRNKHAERAAEGEMTYTLDMQKPYLLCTSPVSSLLTVAILAGSISLDWVAGDGGSAPMSPSPG